MKHIRLLIVDDREIIRDSLKLLFSGLKDITVTGEASDGYEAIDLVKKNDYDVILMDINMPLLNGIEATKEITKINSNTKVLGNSFFISPTYIKDLIKAGARGFITKDESREVYIEAVKATHQGKIYLSDKVNHQVYDKVLNYFNHSA